MLLPLQYQTLLLDSSLTEHDKMAALSYLEYLHQVERSPTAFSGRRVLAAVLMKSPVSGITVLSLGTGESLLVQRLAYNLFRSNFRHHHCVSSTTMEFQRF